MKTETLSLNSSSKDSVASGNDDTHQDKMAALVQNSFSETDFRENPRDSDESDFERIACPSSSDKSPGKEKPDATGGSGKVSMEYKRRFDSVHPKSVSKLMILRPRNLSADSKTRFKSDGSLAVRIGRGDVTSAPPTSQQGKQPDRSRSRRPESPRSRSRSVDAVIHKSPVAMRSGPGSIRPPALPRNPRELSVGAKAVTSSPAAGKQAVVMPRSGRRNTVAAAVAPSAGPQTNGLKRKLNAGKFGFTVSGILPNYQRKDSLRGSLSVDAPSTAVKSTANGAGAMKTGGVFRRSRSLQEFTSVAPLVVSLDGFPDPPEPEEDLNARMELLFEEYRQVELGLIFKTTEGDNNASEAATPVEKEADEKRRSRRSNERGIAGSSAQTPRRSRERGVSQDRSSAKNFGTPRKDSPVSNNTGASKPNHAVQNSPSAVSKGSRTNRTASADRSSKAIGVNWRCSASVERLNLKDSVKNTSTDTVSQEISASIKERRGAKPSGDLQYRKQHQNEAKLSKERLQRPDVKSTRSSNSSLLISNVAKEPSFKVNTEKHIQNPVNRQISHHLSTENSCGDQTNGTDSSTGSDGPKPSAPDSGIIKPSLRKGEGHGLSSKIPVPIRQVKSYSGSRLKHCDSGVDITNSFKFG